MALSGDAKRVLKATSRTFYIPISRLPDGLQEAIGASYLCMRAVDEIEDHPEIDERDKAQLLWGLSRILQAQTDNQSFDHQALEKLFWPYQSLLPEVTHRLGEWCCEPSSTIAPRIWDATASMSERMAQWSIDGWHIHTEADLNHYTFSVAGAVGVLICDVGAWFDGIQMHRSFAIQFGRGLQAVNILRNRAEDLARGVDFFPKDWTVERMHQYARHNLVAADDYARSLPLETVVHFIRIPLVLAIGTLDALARGEEKLSRTAVIRLVSSIA